MKTAFTALVLCLSAFYTYWAFADLSFLSLTGRLGPGFFPRIIGIGLVLACAVELVRCSVRRAEKIEPSEHLQTLVIVAALSAAFVAIMHFLGGYVAMIAFLLATLSILNRGRNLQNVTLALLLPLGVYLLFEVWLNAAVPPGVVFEALRS